MPKPHHPGTCSHNVKLLTGCKGCHSEANRLDRAFDRLVFLGHFNERGFSPAEWSAYQRKHSTTVLPSEAS